MILDSLIITPIRSLNYFDTNNIINIISIINSKIKIYKDLEVICSKENLNNIKGLNQFEDSQLRFLDTKEKFNYFTPKSYIFAIILVIIGLLINYIQGGLNIYDFLPFFICVIFSYIVSKLFIQISIKRKELFIEILERKEPSAFGYCSNIYYLYNYLNKNCPVLIPEELRINIKNLYIYANDKFLYKLLYFLPILIISIFIIIYPNISYAKNFKNNKKHGFQEGTKIEKVINYDKSKDFTIDKRKKNNTVKKYETFKEDNENTNILYSNKIEVNNKNFEIKNKILEISKNTEGSFYFTPEYLVKSITDVTKDDVLNVLQKDSIFKKSFFVHKQGLEFYYERKCFNIIKDIYYSFVYNIRNK